MEPKAIPPSNSPSAGPGWLRRKRLTVALLLAAAGGATWLALEEAHDSRLQARYFAQRAAALSWRVDDRASDAIRLPAHGPFDERMGYTKLAQFGAGLEPAGYAVERQARFSPALLDYAASGYFPPYREKSAAGLDLSDCSGESLYRFRYPWSGYADFDSVPPLVARTLTLIENRDLLDASRPEMNPAVDWVRFGRALVGRAARVVSDDLDAPGGSTLATQIEKYRHSPDGITRDSREKLRQMVSASVRAYRDGQQTLAARQRILLDYLNTVPLSAAPGFGEVNGLSDGLRVWFAADFDQVNRLLAAPEGSGETLARQGQALHQVLALMIAHRRPSFYLSRAGHDELERLSRAHLNLLAAQRLIGAGLRDAALSQPLRWRDFARDPAQRPAEVGKGTMALRSRIAGWLDASLYELDRYDLAAATTLDGVLQREVGDFLNRLGDAEFARAQGLIGDKMLSPATLGQLRYSFTLVERTASGNRVRVQTDTDDQLFDVNEGSKLELGSTAKLRVLASYLEIIAELHARLSQQPADELRRVSAQAEQQRDALTQWAASYLASSPGSGLDAMLAAALERRYSASPGERFFTGGGVHVFNNYRAQDNGRVPTLREALQGSINLPFVRLLRDIVRHTMQHMPDGSAQLVKDDDDPRRLQYLARFADREGQAFLRRFWVRHHGRTPQQMRDALYDAIKDSPERLASAFLYLEPDAGAVELAAFLGDRLDSPLPAARVETLLQRNGPQAYDLPDRGYVARVHPLELWLVRFLSKQPAASWSEAVAASASERQLVYRWLFNTRHKGAQDSRIYTMLEIEAFEEIHHRWARLGYPFARLVPSLASALGSSGDRPAALAELMGVIVNGGMRQKTMRIERLAFAAGTPYETHYARSAAAPERVMAPEVAAALRAALSEVVEGGTARRLSGAFRLADGSALALGGKTGTGDNRIVSSRGGRGLALNRTATFVFYVGERHFGTLTAYVNGADAAHHGFTSALPVQILKAMGPLLLPRLAAGCPG